MTIRLSDYIANYLSQHGIRHVFMMVGGGAMHLNDALGKHKSLETIFCHHEQACAIAAESYARLTNQLPLVNVTTGPGGLNALTGVFGAWTDSIPMLVISGQVKYETTVRSSQLPLRQLGDQEYDIVRSVSPMTKYAVMVMDPKTIRFHLEKAFYLATHGRPGPVWLDIPLNVQSAMIEEKKLTAFDPEKDSEIKKIPAVKEETIQTILEHLQTANSPVILAGTGIRLSGAYQEFRQLVDFLKIPVATAWNAHDILPDDSSYYCGRPGTIGDRAGNFTVQNADVLLILGCRLNIRQISYNWENFAKKAYKIMVDIDELELKKLTLKIDLPVHAHLKDFLIKMLKATKKNPISSHQVWLNWCLERRNCYPVVLDSYWRREKLVNPYCFMQMLSRQLPENQIIVTGDGSACVISFQAMKIKEGQRLYTNSGCAAMGYDLPAAIGACVASNREKIICLAGDGSLQLNIQELAQVAYHQLPIKLFVLNNDGYHSIRQTQQNFFGEPLVGCDKESGVGFPDLEKIADAYNLRYVRCDQHADMKGRIAEALQGDDPVLCEVILTSEQNFEPKLSSRRLPDGKMVSSSLEDMSPFLSLEEMRENTFIKEK